MGNMINMIGGISPKEYSETRTITPTTSDQVINAGTYLKGVLTIKGDSDLISENIREGVNIFDVLGTMPEGAKVVTGTVSITTAIGSAKTIEHGLDRTPTIIFANMSNNCATYYDNKNFPGTTSSSSDTIMFNTISNVTSQSFSVMLGGSASYMGKGTIVWIAIAE